MNSFSVGDSIRCMDYKEARRVMDKLKQEGYVVILDYGKHFPKPVVRISGVRKDGN